MYILAVDAGLRVGYALFDIPTATLQWYRSHNYGALARLRRGAATLIAAQPDLALVVVEGGGSVAEPWQKAADFQRIPYCQIPAERWRQDLLYDRQQRSGSQAKRAAQQHAAQTIADAQAPNHFNQLRHDAAEAILVGEWALRHCQHLFLSDK